MDMTRTFALLLLASVFHALPASAAEPRLVCFGNEPSWSLRFDGGGRATLSFPDGKPVEYRGRETRLDFLKERAWRGTPAGDPKAVVVAFLREATCSDTMSDTAHPVSARVSLPDGRLLAGCCRVPAAPLEGTTWQLTSPGGAAGEAKDATSAPPTVRFVDGRASGFSGCNRFTGGSYTRDGDTADRRTPGRDDDGLPRTPDGDREGLPRQPVGHASHRHRGRPPDPDPRLRRPARLPGRARTDARGGHLEGHRVQQRPAGGGERGDRNDAHVDLRERDGPGQQWMQHVPCALHQRGESPLHRRRPARPESSAPPRVSWNRSGSSSPR